MTTIRKFLALPFIVLGCTLICLGAVITLGVGRGNKAIKELTQAVKGVTK